MDNAIWCRTPAAASAASRLRPEVSKNFSTALSSNEGELARSITTCAPAVASLSPSPVMVLTPLLGEAATTSWPPWRRMATVFEPIRPVPPMTTILMRYPPLSKPRGARAAAVTGHGRMRQRALFRRLHDRLAPPACLSSPHAGPEDPCGPAVVDGEASRAHLQCASLE